MKLSICIPTYNRAKLLLATISHLYSSLESFQLEASVEVLVGDNKSTDNTSSVCDLFKDKTNFKYILNEVNLGAEGNWLNLVSKAKGDFVWILSDDDYFDSVMLKNLVGVLDSKLSLIYLDYYVDDELNEDLTKQDVDYNKYSKFFKKTHGKGAFDFYVNNQFGNTFISSNVFNRRDFLKYQPEFEVYKGNPWLQLYISKFLVSNDGAFQIVPKSGLVMRGEPLMESRSRAAGQGYIHFYYHAHLDFLDFYFNCCNDFGSDLKFDYLSEDARQIVYEKISWKKIQGKEDFPFWLSIFNSKLKDKKFNKSLRFYFVNAVLVLLPSHFSLFLYSMVKAKSKLISKLRVL